LKTSRSLENSQPKHHESVCAVHLKKTIVSFSTAKTLEMSLR
jgi:hypothetical protein